MVRSIQYQVIAQMKKIEGYTNSEFIFVTLYKHVHVFIIQYAEQVIEYVTKIPKVSFICFLDFVSAVL